MLRAVRTTVGGLAALVALAVLVSGAALRADPPKDAAKDDLKRTEPKKDDVKKDDVKKDDVKAEEPKKDTTVKGDTDLQKQLEKLKSRDGVWPRKLIDTQFDMAIGETVVVGTSRIGGDKGLVVLLTAVPAVGK